MTFQYKWPVTGFSIIFLYIVWRHVFDLLQWNQEFTWDPVIRQRHNYQEYIEVVEIESNCGIRHACPDDSFPLFLSTGKNQENHPRLCVAGKYVIEADLNGGGRGLNAAIVEPTHFDVVSVRNFDTYRYNKSTEIKSWLEGVLNNDIVIIFTSDEASVKLSNDVKMMLNELGSGKIQNIQYRSQWYMITQKGTKGFTIYEKLTYSKNKNWGEMIEFRSCIPRRIPKQMTTADESLRENKKREQFCAGKKDNKYQGFCSEPRFEILLPALLTNRSLIGNSVFSVPIFVYASDDLEVFIAVIDSLVHQPGVHLPLVTIFYKDDQIDVPGVSQVYGIQTEKTTSKKNFQEKIRQAKELLKKNHPNQNHLIVIDENVILSPDFLFFMAQTLKTLTKDDSITSISAWSCNCYQHDGDVHLSYRIHGAPKHGVLVPINATDDVVFGDMIVPDVSRVQGPEACHKPSLQADNWIERPQDLTKDRYFHKLVMLQQLSQNVQLDEILTTCSSAILKNNINVVYFQYSTDLLERLLKCLGVLRNRYGRYQGIVRLSVAGKIVMLISSESAFYKSRPIASV